MHQPLLTAISASSMRSMSEFRLRHLATTAWAFSTLELQDRPWLYAIASQARRPITLQGDRENLLGLAWALSSWCVSDRPLWEAIASASIPNIPEMQPQHLMGIAWAFARCEYPHSPLIDAIAAASRKMISASPS
uniref:Uncharacterized protein n=2 Tax=Alexandrium monilatum TaxID=311494 RepID=A0A7S4V8K1_9DINO